MTPVRQAYLNELIESRERATLLSFGSSGGVVIRPVLGRAADALSYPVSYVSGAAIQLLALPLLRQARRERAGADRSSPAAEQRDANTDAKGSS